MSRYFTGISGFLDDTNYIEVTEGASFFHSKNGRIDKAPKGGFLLEFCLSCCERGVWKEITIESPQLENCPLYPKGIY